MGSILSSDFSGESIYNSEFFATAQSIFLQGVTHFTVLFLSLDVWKEHLESR